MPPFETKNLPMNSSLSTDFGGVHVSRDGVNYKTSLKLVDTKGSIREAHLDEIDRLCLIRMLEAAAP